MNNDTMSLKEAGLFVVAFALTLFIGLMLLGNSLENSQPTQKTVQAVSL